MKKTLGILSFLLLGLSAQGKDYTPGVYRAQGVIKGAYSTYTDYVTVKIGKDKKIQDVFIDSFMPINSKNLKEGYTSKRILGDKYGLRKVSTIKKEWNEQVDAIAKSVVDNQGIVYKVNKDKTLDGVAGATIEGKEYTKLINEALKKASK